MKILLISSNIASTPYTVFPLGMSMVAGALERAGHLVQQFDYLHSGTSLGKLQKKITESEPALIGISIRNIDNVNMLNEVRYLQAVEDIIKTIRDQSQAPIVLGGSGFSIMPEAIREKVGADYGISGEGEAAMLKLITDIESGQPPEKGCWPSANDLCGHQLGPARYDPELIKFYLDQGGIATIQTKRGCPHKCAYCTYPIIEGPVYRPRQP